MNTPQLILPRLHWAARHEFEAVEIQEEHARESLLYLVEKGRFAVEIDGRWLEARPGQLLVVQHKMDYKSEADAGTVYRAIFFAPCQFEWDDSSRLLEAEPDDVTVRWIHDLCSLEAQSRGLREVTGHLLAALLAHLKFLEGRTARMEALHPGVAAAVRWIDDHVAQDIRLNELAAQVHCSSSHLRALFKGQVGSGVMRYQQDRRMQLALQLVNHSHLSLPQVARSCGYADPEYFARLFRRYYHQSPGQLRRNHARAEESPAV